MVGSGASDRVEVTRGSGKHHERANTMVALVSIAGYHGLVSRDGCL